MSSKALSKLAQLQMASWTADQFGMFGLPISTDSRNAISSQVADCGASPHGSPDGPTISRCGPDPARANRSRSREKAPVQTTFGICGPTSFASSVPDGPLSSWESKLRERLAAIGSTESALIWMAADMPDGRSISRLSPWTPPISANGSIGSPWPTPQARDGFPPHTAEYVAKHKANGHGMSNLNDTLNFTGALWPTPTVADAQGGHLSRSGARGNELLLKGMMKAAWTTPLASDVAKQSENPETTIRRLAAGRQVGLNAHIALTEYATALIGPTPIGSNATTEKRGAPNPTFACWLMGWPDELISGALRGIASFRSSRRKSSGRSSKPKG